jgi:hypothetical protein
MVRILVIMILEGNESRGYGLFEDIYRIPWMD